MKGKSSDNLGIFNILLIGDNPRAVSIADNIRSSFKDTNSGLTNVCDFNILDDIEHDEKSNSWFNEFIFDLTTSSKFNNIVLSSGFQKWLSTNDRMQLLYMRKLLKAMNTIIIDISEDNHYSIVFDEDIPQTKFVDSRDFLKDLMTWIDDNISKMNPKLPMIRLARTLCGKNLPYLGDVFGCLSGKKYDGIILTDKMRFDVPILFDEFCKLTRGRTMDELENSIIMRSNSSLSAFLK